jgi:hypothetical protein
MVVPSLMLLLSLAAGWLWWKLSLAQRENELLQAEIARLRLRARRLRA